MNEIHEKSVRAARELCETEDAFDALRKAFLARLIATDPHEGQEREQLYMAVRVLDRVKTALERIVVDANNTKLIEDAVDAFQAPKKG